MSRLSYSSNPHKRPSKVKESNLIIIKNKKINELNAQIERTEKRDLEAIDTEKSTEDAFFEAGPEDDDVVLYIHGRRL